MRDLEPRSQEAEKTERDDWDDAFDAQEEIQQDIVEDKEEVAEKAQELNLVGTSEGVDDVKKDIERAGDDIDEEMGKQVEIHNEMASEAEDQEDIIDEKSDKTEEDIELANSLSNEVNTEEARNKIEDARKDAEDDKSFLDKIHSDRKSRRIESEGKTEQQINKVKSTNISFE